MAKKKKKKHIPLPHLNPELNLVDTHCHLDMDAYSEDLQEVIAKAHDNRVTQIITVGIDLISSHKAIALAEQHSGIFATVGVHPHNVSELDESQYDELRRLAKHPKVVGYGEIGMDTVKNYAPIESQREHFIRQVALAKELALPLIIHDREAHEAVFEILQAAAPFPSRGVMHCFSGDAQLAKDVVALGFMVSIPGVVTFNKAEMLQGAVKEVPLDSLLLETDGPFLAPVPNRGKRNDPSLMLYTAQKVAEIKGVSLDELAQATTANAKELFGLGEK